MNNNCEDRFWHTGWTLAILYVGGLYCTVYWNDFWTLAGPRDFATGVENILRGHDRASAALAGLIGAVLGFSGVAATLAWNAKLQRDQNARVRAAELEKEFRERNEERRQLMMGFAGEIAEVGKRADNMVGRIFTGDVIGPNALPQEVIAATSLIRDEFYNANAHRVGLLGRSDYNMIELTERVVAFYGYAQRASDIYVGAARTAQAMHPDSRDHLVRNALVVKYLARFLTNVLRAELDARVMRIKPGNFASRAQGSAARALKRTKRRAERGGYRVL